MEFIQWHYSSGIRLLLGYFSHQIRFLNHYYSFASLLLNLFSPFKRQLTNNTKPGFHPEILFEQWSFNLISRAIGAIVRISIFIVGLFVLGITFLLALPAIFVWITFPPAGFFMYYAKNFTQTRTLSKLSILLKSSTREWLVGLSKTLIGKFISSKLEFNINVLQSIASDHPINLQNTTGLSLEQTFQQVIDQGGLKDQDLSKISTSKEVLLLTGRWWDIVNKAEEGFKGFGKRSLGRDLAYGYTPNLDQFAQDLSTPTSFYHHLIGRKKEVQALTTIIKSTQSPIIVGEPGVGKKTIILEFAKRASLGQLGSDMSRYRILEFDVNSLLSNSKDLIERKKILQNLFSESSEAGNIILFIKDIHRLIAKELEGQDFTDILESALSENKTKFIFMSTRVDFERFININSRIKKYTQVLEVKSPSIDNAIDILIDTAQIWQSRTKVNVTAGAIHKIIEGSDKFITDIPFPEKSLEILDLCVAMCQREDIKNLDSDIAIKVLSEVTGISQIAITKTEKEVLLNLEQHLRSSLIGQDQAIKLISQSLRSRAVGAKDPQKPIGSFLFLGPTGVGKTEAAKALARVYFGGEINMTRLDMSEYQGSEGLIRLIGSAMSNTPGIMTTSIKNKPASLLLLDEIEKSPKEIHNLLLAMLDEGRITDSRGQMVSCKNLIIIATSNAAAEEIRSKVEEGIGPEDLKTHVVKSILEKQLFSPELINRFDGVVVFSPLSKEDLSKVAMLKLDSLAQSLKDKDIYFKPNQELAKQIATLGYNPSFGARPMRRVVDLEMGDVIAKSILEGKIQTGDTITLTYTDQTGFQVRKI